MNKNKNDTSNINSKDDNIQCIDYALDTFGIDSDIYELVSLLQFANITHYICNYIEVYIKTSVGTIIVYFDMNGDYKKHHYFIDMRNNGVDDITAKYNGVTLNTVDCIIVLSTIEMLFKYPRTN